MPDTATSHAVPSQHLDHPELLMLDGAVSRLIDRYLTTRTLTAEQRQVLAEYREDADHMVHGLVGPARDYAEQLVALLRTVLDATASALGDAHPAPSGASYAA